MIRPWCPGTCLVRLGRGLHTWIDARDLRWMAGTTWCARACSCALRLHHYVGGRPESETVPLHRWLLGARPRLVVDHISGDSLDNRRCNIHEVTRSRNVMNRHAAVNAPLSTGWLPPGIPVIAREALKATAPGDLAAIRALWVNAPLSPWRAA